MQKFAALLAYNGTDYCGWQKQKGSAALGRPSLQQTIEEVLSQITQEEVRVIGSGRTDAGVHAYGQVMHFVIQNKTWDPFVLWKGLNSLLPRAIRIHQVQEVEVGFHAQKSAIKKTYFYRILQGPTFLPEMDAFGWWIKKDLDWKAMSEALKKIEGQHDFEALQASGANPGPTIRTLFFTQVEKSIIPLLNSDKYSQIIISVQGSGFLKQMVRSIVGMLVAIGESKSSIDELFDIVEKKQRSRLAPTAPGRGLFLKEVNYPDLTWDFSQRLGRV
ncbi:MAG: tRNA pseudouridine(38-40) synthase TruA [Bdellovibrionaceae bacterium]|nr:tRNA pseudouridine(38-40) synthase TruA [Pseudobdellovibrionaceae bacterium]|tara:strand:- start:3639 stop:4460 length:822 start_codon:yes stop_codon:yes gene_type:complete